MLGTLDMLRLVLFAGLIVWLAWAIARFIRARRFSLANKVVLITGGSRGLGLVLARQVRRAGGKVVLLARDAEELARACTDLGGDGSNVLVIPCDLSEPAQIRPALAQITPAFRDIDVLINNAGIIQVGPLQHMQREDFDRAIRVHFWAPFELTMQIIPEMRRRGGGRIVNISSIGGKMAMPHLAPYNVSKFALTGFSDAIRAELARDKIYVTTVAPGLMRTGSPINAQFKGRHDAEFAWFAGSSSIPLISMTPERAARKILAACRRGQPSLTLTFAARAAILGNALFPNLTGYMMQMATRFLPAPGDARGDNLQPGWESHSRSAVPSWITRLSDRAAARNNEVRRKTEKK